VLNSGQLLAGTAKQVELYDRSGRSGSGKFAIFDIDSATQCASRRLTGCSTPVSQSRSASAFLLHWQIRRVWYRNCHPRRRAMSWAKATRKAEAGRELVRGATSRRPCSVAAESSFMASTEPNAKNRRSCLAARRVGRGGHLLFAIARRTRSCSRRSRKSPRDRPISTRRNSSTMSKRLRVRFARHRADSASRRPYRLLARRPVRRRSRHSPPRPASPQRQPTFLLAFGPAIVWHPYPVPFLRGCCKA
jgi:hypothetical protein